MSLRFWSYINTQLPLTLFSPFLVLSPGWCHPSRVSFLQCVCPGCMQGGGRDGGNVWLSSGTQWGPVWPDDGAEPLSEQQVSRRDIAGKTPTRLRPVKPISSDLSSLFPPSRSRCVQGLCVPKGQTYSCRCSEGYQGQYCDRRQEPPACRGQRCGHGECRLSETGEPVCHCQPRYTGPTCDTGKMENIRRGIRRTMMPRFDKYQYI